MPTSHPNEDVRRWPPGKSLEFDKLVIFSAWLLLASYDEGDDTLDDAAIGAFEEGDGNIWDEELDQVEGITWRRWRHLDDLEDSEFISALADEIIPSLERDFPDPGHPITLARYALQNQPIGVVRREWLRAINIWDTGGGFNREAARDEWDLRQKECCGSGHPLVLPDRLQDFLAAAVVPQFGGSFLDLSARDGGVANRAAELGARRFTLYERDSELALLAATQIRLHRSCEFSVYLDDPLVGFKPEPIYDCVVAALPFGQKVDMADSEVPVRTRRAELLQLQRAILALKPGGRAAVLMPNRFLFADGDDRRVREWLLREHCVEAVVDLGGGHTFPSSEVKATLLLVRRQSPREDVWFIRNDQFVEASESSLSGNDDESLDYRILHAAIAARWNLGKRDELLGDIAKLEVAASNEKYELVDPEGVAWLTQNNRQLLCLARHFLGAPTPGVRFPELVPVSTLARRNSELLWKGECDDLDDWLKQIEQIPEVRIATIGELAQEIFVGVPYSAAKTTANLGGTYTVREDGDASVGLVRISDLPMAKGDTRAVIRAQKALTDQAVTELHPRQFLQDGDLLISRSGTVGKTGVFVPIEASDQKAVAANGLFVVRVGDKTLANFLSRLLLTAPYQAAIQTESTGSTIQHLRTETIRMLRVPVLPTAERLRLMDSLQPGVSAETMLAALQSRKSYTVALRYLMDRPVVSEFVSRPGDEPWPSTHEALREVLAELRGAEDDATRGEQAPYISWTKWFVRAATDLDEILTFPTGADQFAALQSWRQRLRASDFRKAYDEVRRGAQSGDQQDSNSIQRHMLRRCEQLHDRLVALSRSVAEALLGNVEISATVAPAVITVGKLTEIQFSATNGGSLPLRRFGAATTTFTSETTSPLFPAGGNIRWSLSFMPKEVGRQMVNLTWKAHRLDDKTVFGSIELAVDVQSQREDVASVHFQKCPYVAGLSLSAKDRDKFYGRQEIRSEILRSLRGDGPGTVLILEGVRRVGKTSLLKQLLAPDALPGWLPVYCSLQRGKGDATKHGLPTSEIFYLIAQEVVAAAHATGFTVNVPEFRTVLPTDASTDLKMDMRKIFRPAFNNDPSPFELLESVIESVLAGIDGHHLLLMLDEFDKVQVGIETGVTSPQVPDNLRELFHSHAKVSAILSGSQLMKRLRREYFSPLFGLARAAIPIGALDRDSAEQLVTRPAEGLLVYSHAACDRILDLCACQPFLIQHICAEVFNICATDNIESVTVEHVERAAEAWLEREQHFSEVWRDDVEDPRRQYLLCTIAELEAKGSFVTFELLHDTLEERHLSGDKALADHLDHLMQLTVVARVERDGRKIYRIAVPLLSRWLAAKVDASQYLARALREDEGRL